ncbi:endochitinase-like [Episyrphus balteatus]|uniref:endochitinase-like n=1 Tax=Episyrphus balteatus TaxID=286459 RepID=UPI002485D9D6|nr:endochitinase-like [Episyrphus balteatus]
MLQAFIHLILPILLLSISAALAQNANKGVVVCYFSNWAVYRPGKGSYGIKDFPAETCTHGIYSFIGLNAANSQVQILDQELDVNRKGFLNFANMKNQYPNLKTLVAIGGWNEGAKKYSDMSADKNKRAAFVQSIVAFLKQYNFDGLDLDWEYPGAGDRGGAPADKANFVKLVEELRAAFDREGRGWELTMATGAAPNRLQDGYDIPALSKSIDFFNIMTYDLRGSWTGFADVHSPLFKKPYETADYLALNVHDVLANWEKLGCPANKLVVGIPFYGRSFTLASASQNKILGATIPTVGSGSAGAFTGEGGLLAYYEICGKDQGWTRNWDNDGKVPYAYKGNQWVGYEDEKSVQAKMDFIKQKGYRGGMVWAIDLDDFQGTCGPKNPLVSVMAKNMASYTVPGVSATTPSRNPISSPLPNVPQVSPTKPAPVAPTKPQPTSNMPLPDCSSSSFAPHKNCGKFYQCVYGRAVEMNCQPGLSFNAQVNICDWPANNPRPECRQ